MLQDLSHGEHCKPAAVSPVPLLRQYPLRARGMLAAVAPALAHEALRGATRCCRLGCMGLTHHEIPNAHPGLQGRVRVLPSLRGERAQPPAGDGVHSGHGLTQRSVRALGFAGATSAPSPTPAHAI